MARVKISELRAEIKSLKAAEDKHKAHAAALNMALNASRQEYLSLLRAEHLRQYAEQQKAAIPAPKSWWQRVREYINEFVSS
jgi:hypothetical protein